MCLCYLYRYSCIGGGCCSRYLPADGKRFAGGIADGDAECRVPSDGWFP